MFRSENTGMMAWKRIVDEEDNPVANLEELYNGDWSIVKLSSLDWVTETRFSNPTKAVNWLWKNRFDLGAPFDTYPEKEKVSKKKKLEVAPEIIEEPSEDLFWNYKIKGS